MITAQVEPLSANLLKEMQPILLSEHWNELALNKDKVPCDPQWDEYWKRAREGSLLILTVRKQGLLIGYFVGFVSPGLHYRTCLTCILDVFYIHPEYRGKMAGLILMRAVEKELRRRGCQRWFMGSKVHADASRLFEAFGFVLVEKHYALWLGD